MSAPVLFISCDTFAALIFEHLGSFRLQRRDTHNQLSKSYHLGMNATPIRSETFDEVVGGKRTQFIITKFSNYTFVIVTQTGKIGILARIAPLTEEQAATGAKGQFVEAKILLGPDEPLTHVVARKLVDNGQTTKVPILIGFSLDMKVETAAAVADALRTHHVI